MARGRRDGMRQRSSSGDSDRRRCCQEATAEGNNGEHGAGKFQLQGAANVEAAATGTMAPVQTAIMKAVKKLGTDAVQ